MDTELSVPVALQDNEELIIAWLQQNAVPVQRVEAGGGFADLQPLKTMLRDVKVLGLGETTHGTREFNQIKHRLLEFLVVEMGFTALAMEASFSACQPINDYVMHGKGDRATVLTGQGYVVWDTEEIADMVDWMRGHNQTVRDERKVKFHGVDLGGNNVGREAVLAYLRKTDADRVKATENLFAVLADAEAKWPRQIDAETKQSLVQALPELQNLIEYLTESHERPDNHSSEAERARALQYARVMMQWLKVNAGDLLPKADVRNRSACMGDNLIELIDQAGPNEKFIIWQHNTHISAEGFGEGEPNLGSTLREKFGQAYFALGFEFGEGSFQSRAELPDRSLGDLKEAIVPAPLTGSLPWYLSRTGVGNLILPLRLAADDEAVERWLQTPQRVHNAGWVFQEDIYQDGALAKRYDGVIYIDRTTATRPTMNALQTVARRGGL
jgi:erythromycin esterase